MNQLSIFEMNAKSIDALFPENKTQEQILKKAKAKGIDAGKTVYLDGVSEMTIKHMYFKHDVETGKLILSGYCEWGKNTWISWNMLSNRIQMEGKK